MVIENENGYVLIFCTPEETRHSAIIDRFGEKSKGFKIIGGGKISPNRSGGLTLYDQSYDYGPVPKEILELFTR